MSDIKNAYLAFQDKSSGISEYTISYKDMVYSMEYLIEVLTFSSPEDIFQLLEERNNEDIMEMPFWFRSLAFKLLTLKSPTSKKYLESAINDLQLFNDIWEPEIIKYQEMLDKL